MSTGLCVCCEVPQRVTARFHEWEECGFCGEPTVMVGYAANGWPVCGECWGED